MFLQLMALRIAAGSGEHSTDTYGINLLKGFEKPGLMGKPKDIGADYQSLGCEQRSRRWSTSVELCACICLWIQEVFSRHSALYWLQPWSLVYVSETKIGNNNLGIHMQFDNRLGLGIRFGPDERHDLSASWRHVSNAGADENNQGFDSSSIA